jgi:hypothetical protein
MIGLSSVGTYLNARFVIELTKRAGHKVLTRQGAYVRGIAKRKIRRRKSTKIYSAPGTPPFTHTGALKKSIVFAAGPESVVIGPSYSEIGRIGHTHEFGGTEPAKKSRLKKNNWKLKVGGHGPVAMRGGKVVIGRLYTSTQVARAKRIAQDVPAGMTIGKSRRKYPKRSFMGPALMEARPKLSEFWMSSISKTG